ncbi:hypothetical protein Avbf_10246 [Armadillidium vulgare]|nr:hypothetical protein Avbf_10246 [Armadillidium vulgare]
MSESDDDIYKDLSLSGSVAASNEENGSPNKLNELNFFEECIISKETEKAAKKLSDLKSELEKTELELKATKTKKEAIIFRRAMRQIPKDEFDRVVSRIAAYNKEEVSDFLQILNSRKNDELKSTDSAEHTFPKVSYKNSENVKESVLGSRVSEKSHSQARHLKRLQTDKKNFHSVYDNYLKSEKSRFCDSDSRKEVEKDEINKISDDKRCEREKRNRLGYNLEVLESQNHSLKGKSTLHTRSGSTMFNKEVDKISSDNNCNNRKKTKSSNDSVFSSDSNRYSSRKRRSSSNSKEIPKEPYKNNALLIGNSTDKLNSKTERMEVLEDGEICSDDNEENLEVGETLEKHNGESESGIIQQKVNDIRAWRIPKLLSRKPSDGKENKLKDLNEKQERNSNSNTRARDRSSKTLSEKNDGRYHSSKTRDVDERTLPTKNNNNRKYDRAESRKRSPRKRDTNSRQSRDKTLERRRESNRASQNYDKRSESRSHRNDAKHRKTSKNDSSIDMNIFVENLRERKLMQGNHMRSISRQPHHSIYKLRRMKRELRESYHREYKRSKSKIHSRERPRTTSSCKDNERYPSPSHISRNTRKSRSSSSHRSQNLTNVDREKVTEKNLRRDSRSCSSKSDHIHDEHRQKNSNKDKKHLNKDFNDNRGRKSRDTESSDRVSNEKVQISTKETHEKFRYKSDKELERKSRENENTQPETITITEKNKLESLGNNDTITKKEKEKCIVENQDDMISSTEQNQTTFPESSEKNNSPHTLLNTTTTNDHSNFRFGGTFLDEGSRNNGISSHDEGNQVILELEEPLLGKNCAHSAAENNQSQDRFQHISPDGKKNKHPKHIAQSLSVLLDTESSVAFSLTANLNEKELPEEDTFDTFIRRHKEIQPESVMLQNDDSEMSLLKYIGNDFSKQKFDQSSNFIAISPPPFVIPLLKSPVKPADKGKRNKALVLAEVEVDSSQKEMSESISETNYLSRPDHLSPVCSLPSVGFPAPTPPASRLPYSLNALQSMETPHKTLSTSSCSPIPVATPLDLVGDVTQSSTPPPLSSTLKSSTPVVVFDLDKKPSFVRDRALLFLKKACRTEVGSIQSFNVSQPLTSSVPSSEKSTNVSVEYSVDREGCGDQNTPETEACSTPSMTTTKPDNLSQNIQNKNVDVQDSVLCNLTETNESGKKKIPFVTISKEVSKKGDLFSTHDQYGFAASFYKNLDEFQYDWPSRNKSVEVSKKSSADKVSQEKSSAFASNTTDSDSCSNSASSSTTSSSSSGSSSSSSSSSTSSSNDTGSRSTSPSKGAENKTNSTSSSQNSPYKTSFKDSLTVSPTKKNVVISPIIKQSPKNCLQKPHSRRVSQPSEKDESAVFVSNS